MKIKKGAYPPNYLQIKTFLNPGPNTVFTYDDTIYVPNGKPLSGSLKAHEAMHVAQQAELGADNWWHDYMHNPLFRADQEVEAYQVQYQYMVDNYGRERRRQGLDKIASDLSGELYGNIMSKKEAKRLIMNRDELVPEA